MSRKCAFAQVHVPLSQGRRLVTDGDIYVRQLGWRIELDGASLALSGDTDGNNGVLEPLAQGVALMVAHNAVTERTTGAPRALHMPPSVIGRIAHEAKVGTLLLSHRMTRTLGREDETRAQIARAYHGETRFANDLDCFAIASEDRTEHTR